MSQLGQQRRWPCGARFRCSPKFRHWATPSAKAALHSLSPERAAPAASRFRTHSAVTDTDMAIGDHSAREKSDDVADALISGMVADRLEIAVGLSEAARWMSRIAPGFCLFAAKSHVFQTNPRINCHKLRRGQKEQWPRQAELGAKLPPPASTRGIICTIGDLIVHRPRISNAASICRGEDNEQTRISLWSF